jgi:hypothetical protein
MPVSIVAKTFPFALTLAANHFTVPFNYIPFAIASDTDHFNPLPNRTIGAIESWPFTGRRTMQRFQVIGKRNFNRWEWFLIK